ncbi:hypothetical protein A4X17_00355 [Plantibacter sp. H53]|uniref:pyridoxamine 5'-phosphate oxidase family protein n=1 Tax=Plantibacter sp. H53 TaxID=1827323 RepID=UPI0007F39D76|nr:pyridoxamine 5'-phosphate oxidase family protein [Plantibacter sp. H53]OAN35852.1 hypothetical protein A4X17_00355 [Plantibacter sp. H53]
MTETPRAGSTPGATRASSSDNPYWRDTSVVHPVDAKATEVEHLDEEACWALAVASKIGRIAVVNDDGGPDLLPVNFLVHDRHIYIRSAPGSKLMDITSRPRVAFEVDGHDADSWWSVIAHGSARRLAIDAEIDESGVLGLDSWSPTVKSNFIRITPARLTGRRFPRRIRPATDEWLS